MNRAKNNNLLLIENGQLKNYFLDSKIKWDVGRATKENRPDIAINIATVSRKHGRFQNINGVWFYVDYNGRNGTIYNHKQVGTGMNGRIKPLLLHNGDTFVFGGGQEEVINCKTVWGMFMENSYPEEWRVVDTKDLKSVVFISEGKDTTLVAPKKGTVIEKENGIAIYMGDLSYINGDMKILGV